ncbi:hypothetical protein PR048_030430 [Dryococelus australis]|uniref:Reverse transcriptase RNase H-like domain-containing protein n=1 Tax=Dryococelus australis TaxID=614101 RepID=A0ABQ9GCU0_9NEOP|nr:hypothetical protein PR048_030430 [Dryococelus australis]
MGKKSPLFASSTLSKAEQNYTQIDREALAIIFAKFVLVTDHQPLRRLFGHDHGIPTLANSRLQ